MTNTEHPTKTEVMGPVAELRFALDPTEAPLAFPVFGAPDGLVGDVEVEVVGPGVRAELILPLDGARAWAGELFAAVSVGYREATGDPHALTDAEPEDLEDPNAYDPGPGLLVHAEDDDVAARVRFQLVVDIEGRSLSTADLRAALVDHLAERFNVAHVAVSGDEVVTGHPWSSMPVGG